MTMMKSILPAAIVSLLVVSAAWALPVSSTTQLPPLSANGVIQVKNDGHNNKNYNHKNYNNKNYNYNNKNYNNKHYNNNYKHYNYNNGGKYYYHNRYWGHRYYARPYNWQTLGCIVVGPVWYCP
jgi:hypothetical protein